jgi:hypothetical protein
MLEQLIGLVWSTAPPVEADELSANWDRRWDYPDITTSLHNFHIQC